ncbi:MAG: hypothetical protein KDD32_07550 [Bacteroidetes bacterium]|nr:hypothetical protein [Bacteroidota bacterium]
MLRNHKLSTLTLLFVALISVRCGSGGTSTTSSDATKVKMFSLSDPQSLNPYNAQGEQRTYMGYQVSQCLVNTDFKTYQPVPVLAKERPVFSDAGNGLSKMSLEIRPEAVWDNGTPVTAEDVAFSLKVLRTPKTDNEHLKPLLEFIKAVEIDPENPKKFDLIIEPYMIAEGILSDLPILPRYVYDPEDLLGGYTVAGMVANKADLPNDPVLDKYAEQFNSEKFKREVMAGSGPYTFDRWETNQRQVFKLKEDWYGHQLKDENHWFQAYPKELIYETITDLTTAVVALKGESIDVMRSINPKDFVEDLRENEKFLEKFETYTPPQFSYDYIGLNLRNPKFEDVKTRLALAYLMDVNQLVESFCFGLGVPVASIIHPSLKDRLNPDIKPIPFDIEKAKVLLKEAGWGDANGDGILDREYDGEQLDFKFVINYNNGNDRRKTACLIFQEACRKVGIEVNIQVLEWSNILEATKKHEFEAYVGGWISSPNESDPTQIWHTQSYNGGSNYVGFGNAQSDALIEEIRRTLDADKRNELFKELQAVIRAEMPYIFLLSQKERIAIHKKYDNAEASGIRPGYWMNGFMPKETM